MRARPGTAVLLLGAVVVSGCHGDPPRPGARTATAVVEGAPGLVWQADENAVYDVAVAFRLRNPADVAMPEASYRLQVEDGHGAVLHSSLPQRTALGPRESRYVLYVREGVSEGRAPESVTVTAMASPLREAPVSVSAQWKASRVRMACDVEQICEVTGDLEWTGDRPASSPVIGVLGFDRAGRLVVAGLGGGPGDPRPPHRPESFEILTIGRVRTPAKIEVVAYAFPE